MIAIAVDDEALMLGALVAAIEASPDITEVNKFSDCDKALEFVKEKSVDIAFLDINMRGMGGLALAQKITEASPDCKIVFCTGYEEYAIPAFKLHASGYLMKPISAEDVQGEIDNIIGVRHKEKPTTFDKSVKLEDIVASQPSEVAEFIEYDAIRFNYKNHSDMSLSYTLCGSEGKYYLNVCQGAEGTTALYEIKAEYVDLLTSAIPQGK